jgi:broad specificity phosphatase PhoE
MQADLSGSQLLAARARALLQCGAIALGLSAFEEDSVIVKLVRHGTSKANTGEMDPQVVGDFRIPLADIGHEQALSAGAAIGAEFLRGALIYTSPYLRARQTLQGLLDGARVPSGPGQVRVYEDPRLREVDHGYASVRDQQEMRETHGWFYYRYSGGESPADCFDRTSGFLEGLMRQVPRKNADHVLIVTHGLTIRCFVMRFLHLTVEQFEEILNPGNGDIITLANRDTLQDTQFTWGHWAVAGLRLDEHAPNQ